MIEMKRAITPQEIEDAKSVRIAVFQKEQGIVKELDFDGQDEKAFHFVAYDGLPIGALRVRFIEDNKQAKIERVAVLFSHRGKGIGSKLMIFINDYLTNQGVQETYLDSQEHAKNFYEKLGYRQKGEAFEEVGIPHVKMVKSLI